MADHLNLPWRILPAIGYFILAELFIHLVYCILVWKISEHCIVFFKVTPQRALAFSLGLWGVGMITILAANQWLFPNSKFAELTLIVLNNPMARIITLSGISVLSIAFIIASFAHYKMVVLGVSLFALQHFNFIAHPIATQEKPNIIIVGVDSLRPDFLGFFGHAQRTPFFDHFLNQAIVFSDAVTPLARTFPSWTSILTGEYPKTIGIRTNLAEHEYINLSSALPFILKQSGYETAYAADETRFSNIGTEYGFQHVITPPVGLNDFLLGTFNDFPLSNLLINTIVGKWLFPYSYANRPAYFAYEPDRFLEMIEAYLSKPKTKPLFLAIHFCLPHYPYLWAGLSGRLYEPLARYERSIQRVDQQLSDFFGLLQKAHLLDRAIVVLLSDHGEAMELPGDRITEKALFRSDNPKKPFPLFYPPGLDHEEVNQSVGHGTDVLSLTQYHTLLALKLYGMEKSAPRIIPDTVSLLTIKPMVLHFAHLATAPFTLIPTPTHIFLESDFTPQAIRTVHPEMHDVILEGIQLFQINQKTTKLTVTAEMNQKIIESKQYADIYDHWMLAMYPQSTNRKTYILVNLLNGQWTDDLHSRFAQSSPAPIMLAALNQFFGMSK